MPTYLILAALCYVIGIVTAAVLFWANMTASLPRDKVSYWPAGIPLILATLLMLAWMRQ